MARALFEYYKVGVASLLIRGCYPRPDAVQDGEELIPRGARGWLTMTGRPEEPPFPPVKPMEARQNR